MKKYSSIYEKYLVYILLGVVCIILGLLATKHTDIEDLVFFNVDDSAFFGVLFKMHGGLAELHSKKLFAYSFYTYGFSYFFSISILAYPFFSLQQYDVVIWIARLFSFLPAVLTLLYLYKISRIYLSPSKCIVIVLLVLCMPSFWVNALSFHPDWLSLFFVAVASYYFIKDNLSIQKKFWVGVFCLGFAIGVKLQSLLFVPILFFIIFREEVFHLNFKDTKRHILLAVLSTLLLIVIFIANNPYLLVTRGREVFMNMLRMNIEDNRTNHFSFIDVPIIERIQIGFEKYYQPIIIIGIAIGILVFYWIKHKQKIAVIHIIIISTIIQFVFILVSINKSWQHYFLGVGVFFSLLFVCILSSFKEKGVYILYFLITIQIYLHYERFKEIYDDGYSPSKKLYLHLKDMNDDKFISTNIAAFTDENTFIVLDLFTYFKFRALHIPYQNMTRVHPFISKSNIDINEYVKVKGYHNKENFRQPDVIIINKTGIDYWLKEKEYQKLQADISSLYQDLEKEKLNYKKIAENSKLIIFKIKK